MSEDATKLWLKIWVTCLLIAWSLVGCQREASHLVTPLLLDQSSDPEPNQSEGLTPLSREATQAHTSPPPHYSTALVIAATREASPLVKGVLHQLNGGDPWAFSLAFNVDDALRAARDQVTIGAFYLQRSAERRQSIVHHDQPHHIQSHTASQRESAQTYDHRVASSYLWWAHRGATSEVSQKTWVELISGQRARWPQGELFQLCLRVHPDPLEELWIQSYPTLADALKRARSSGRWPVFKDDEQLLSYVTAHAGSVALFSVGNLKLRGAPLSQVMIRGAPAPQVMLSLYLRPFESLKSIDRSLTQERLSDLNVHLQTLRSALNDDERPNAVREWGWEP